MPPDMAAIVIIVIFIATCVCPGQQRRRRSPVPVGQRLIGSGGAQQGPLLEGPPKQLQPDR